ncbi:hypothetical protein BGX21_003453 [Mortierella sp. AD011]|nr:hypothetical protein BGX21_003453 [Mortierella sp. AD011]
MHRSFIQPPSNGSQQQQRRRKWSHSQIGSSVYANDTKVVGIAISVAQRPRLTTPIMTEINLINSGNYINQTRQLLKHKLDDNEIETRQESHSFMNDTLPKITASPSVRAPMVQTPLSLMTHNLSSSSYGSMAPPSTMKQSVPNIGSSRSLSDRRKMTASQVSRRFIIGSNSSSITSSQSTQRFSQSSNHPILADTIPSQSTQLRAFDPTKTKKSSEFAKRIVLPASEAITNQKSKKRAKFTPPLVSGGYAERLVNLMTYHKSEYIIWANATLRQDKLFGSTEPLAVVEVKEIFRDCNLQWTRCIVIPNENNKAPFNVSPEGDQQYIHGSQDVCQSQQKVSDEQSMTPGILDADIVKSTPSQDLHEFVEDESAEFNIDEGDSISGLHKDMSKMGVLVSSQGSVFEGSSGDFMKSQQRASTNFETGLVAIDEERDDSAPILQFLKSSQGSDDGAEEFGLNFGRRRETLGPAHKIQNIAPSVNLQCIKDLNQSDDILSINKANEHSRSSQAIVSTTTNASGLKTSASYESVCLRSSHWIVFSNLFNWSRLKVTDKVEIHAPCRKVVVSEPRSNERCTKVWIVERYKVVSA